MEGLGKSRPKLTTVEQGGILEALFTYRTKKKKNI